MVSSIREYAPVTLLQQDGHLALRGRRFMGTLLYPVPRSEMCRRCGVDTAGEKIVVDWPGGDACPVQNGDVVEVAGRRYRVWAIDQRPGCYLNLYVLAS